MKANLKHIRLALVLALMSSAAKAQLNPVSAQYFSNRYIADPAMAGTAPGYVVNGAYRTLWSTIPGAPVSQHLTGEYGFGKVGLGLSLYNESAGLLKQTRAVGTYAYHIDLDRERSLHFGLSMGLLNQRINSSELKGSQGDLIIGEYNERGLYFDGDFGMAYTSGGIGAEFSLPNLKRLFKRQEVTVADEATFYAAASYKLVIEKGESGAVAEPKLVYRGVRGFDNIWDAGLQVGISGQQVLFTGIYHSTQNATFGLGMDLKRKYLINAFYTSQTSALNKYTNGSFELNLRIAFGK